MSTLSYSAEQEKKSASTANTASEKKTGKKTETTPTPAPTSSSDASKETENTSNRSTTTFNRADIKITAPANENSQSQQDLKHFLPATVIKPMMAGPDDFLTLVSPSLSNNDRGIAILLPDWQQTATSPKAINFLRKKLPLDGWTTITLQPKSRPLGYPSTIEKEALALEENNKLLVEYQTSLIDVFKSVMAMAEDYPGIIMVISQGNNAAQLQALYHDDKLEKPNVFIMLSAYMPTKNDNIIFAQQLSQTELATLDLILIKDHPLVITNAIYRKQLADKEMKVTYRQRQLSNLRSGYYPNQDLLRQINGWLRSIGW